MDSSESGIGMEHQHADYTDVLQMHSPAEGVGSRIYKRGGAEKSRGGALLPSGGRGEERRGRAVVRERVGTFQGRAFGRQRNAGGFCFCGYFFAAIFPRARLYARMVSGRERM